MKQISCNSFPLRMTRLKSYGAGATFETSPAPVIEAF